MGFRRKIRTPNTGTVVTPPPTSYLPFDIPAAAQTGASPKKLLAHYFNSINKDNMPNIPATSSSHDTFGANWITPASSPASGGHMRNRPMARKQILPNTTPSWWQEVARVDIREAIESGIDGFWVNIMSLDRSGSGGSDFVLRYQALWTVAAAEFPQFKVCPMLDQNALTNQGSVTPNVTTVAMMVNDYRNSAWYENISGTDTMIIGTFFGDRLPDSWYTSLRSTLLANHGITAKMLHAGFLNLNTNYYSANTYGIGIWGYGADPAVAASGYPSQLASAHNAGVKWSTGAWIQDCRPDSNFGQFYKESLNTLALTNIWDWICNNNSDHVQACTWNDYIEGSIFQKSSFGGQNFADIQAYWACKWKTGSFPPIVRDCVYVSYRNHVNGATILGGQTSFMSNTGSTATRYAVEALTFLTAPATLSLTVGGSTTNFNAPAGVARNIVTAVAGNVSATVTRSSTVVASLTGLPVIRTQLWAQDANYMIFGSLRGPQYQFDHATTNTGGVPIYPVIP